MAELSRGELLAWVNDLTQLNLPKVESCGMGGAHCLILNSIYGDLPVHKVNFKAIHEYEYVHNFKVLQEAFTRHRIDRTIPVDRLIKLKFQDNLEFLQWMKKFWDANYEGGNVVVRNVPVSKPVSVSAGVNKPVTAVSRSASITQKSAPAPSAIPNNPTATTNNNNTAQLAALTKTITELKLSVDEMEKERDFYFNKLRDIEILTQKITDPAISASLFFKQITEILYTTEEGFEIPQETKVEGGTGNISSSNTIMTN